MRTRADEAIERIARDADHALRVCIRHVVRRLLFLFRLLARAGALRGSKELAAEEARLHGVLEETTVL